MIIWAWGPNATCEVTNHNGAVDNATGVAALLSMANAFSCMEPPSKRSIPFAAVGAEEQGLLGSKFFAENSPLPPGKMAAVINMDGTNIIGRTHDVNVIGYGKSKLDSIVKAAAKDQKRIVTPDIFPTVVITTARSIQPR